MYWWREVKNMNPRIVYPIPKRQYTFYTTFRHYYAIASILISVICIIVNILTHTKPWSVIVVWSLFSLWSLVFSLKIVEFSIFAHAIRSSLYIIILLGLIDYFIAPGWAQTVIPIVLFATMLVMLIIYFITYDKRERHLASILLLGLIVIISIPYSINSFPITNRIALWFHIASLIMFIVLLIINRKEVLYEIKARLNMFK